MPDEFDPLEEGGFDGFSPKKTKKDPLHDDQDESDEDLFPIDEDDDVPFGYGFSEDDSV